jgi:Cu(I)/Ag(I) efflux system membrane fusion protein
MDMDLLPKYADEEKTAGVEGARVEMSPEAMAAAGVATARVEKAKLEHVLRAVGTIEPDERTLVHIASRVAGRLDRLYLDFTGQTVRRGAPVFEIYSPELVTSQRELLLAADNLSRARASGDHAYIESAESLLASSRERLSRWGFSGDQVAEIERKRKPETEMVYRSPVSGTVIQKTAVTGQYVTEGQDLYVLADLTHVWLAVQVYEYELGNIRIGAPVRATVTSFPGREFLGRVAFVDPVLDPATRTGRLRVEIPNPDGLLKPGMFANAELGSGLAEGLAVPKSAVIDTGARQIVYVRTGPTAFAAREVRLGATAGNRVAVLSGLAEGEEVVAAAGFLIDAQSQLATGASVQWGGATEVRATPSPVGEAPR